MNIAKCIWFTGLPCSGKTTIASGLQERLYNNKIKTIVLDGDSLRSSVNSDLGFDEKSRNESIRRVASIAHLLYSQNITVIVSTISPLRKHRDFARQLFCKDIFFEIYLSTSLDVCEKRDIKGMYRKARNKEIHNFTGIGSKYEIPKNSFLELDTAKFSIDQSIDIIHKKIF